MSIGAVDAGGGGFLGWNSACRGVDIEKARDVCICAACDLETGIGRAFRERSSCRPCWRSALRHDVHTDLDAILRARLRSVNSLSGRCAELHEVPALQDSRLNARSKHHDRRSNLTNRRCPEVSAQSFHTSPSSCALYVLTVSISSASTFKSIRASRTMMVVIEMARTISFHGNQRCRVERVA